MQCRSLAMTSYLFLAPAIRVQNVAMIHAAYIRVSVFCCVIRSSDELVFTSYVRMAGRCVNCTLRCDGYLCRHCEDHVQCINCRRYLPQHCYSDASKRCLTCVRKLSQTRSTVRNIVNEISIPTARGTESFNSFVVTNSGVIQAFVEDYRRQYGSIRIHVRVDAVFTREVDGSLLQRIPAFFSSAVQDVDSTQQLDLAAVASDLSAQADHWNSRGSGFVLEHNITKFVLCISKHRFLHGSTYIPSFAHQTS